MPQYKITAEDVLAATEQGKTVILSYYPQASAGFTSRRNFRMRPDDRNPSGCVFFAQGKWFIQDKGGSDTGAKTAISLVMEQEGLKYPQAIDFIAEKFAPQLTEGRTDFKPAVPKPKLEQVAAQDEITVQLREDGQFTAFELEMLGYKITQDICNNFSLKPVDSYITRKNEKGKSFRISSTENYPIYYYDYRTFGKLYQPLGDVRFLYVGEKPSEFLFGDNLVRTYFEKSKRGEFNTADKGDVDDEYTEDSSVDERLEDLIICSGPSDALNTYAAGYHVCWPNSESEDISPVTMTHLFKISKERYVMYDLDETGMKNMYKLALEYLEVRPIVLPERLKTYRTRRGGVCKDAKDFMMYYRERGRSNPHQIFRDLVLTSTSLQFWVKIQGKYGISYDLDNIPLYAFLSANGFHKIPSPSERKGYRFCHVDRNIVEIIPDEMMSSRCNDALISYLKEHTKYFSPILLRNIIRSKQMNLSSLDKLPSVCPDFHSSTRDAEHFFFRNCVVKVTADGVEEIPLAKSRLFVYKDNIIEHDFSTEKSPFFNIGESREYIDAQAALAALPKMVPASPEYVTQKRKLDRMEEERRWSLELLRNDCSFMQYLYNTGRNYWRKEEVGFPLTEQEAAETRLNFINKVMAIGYMLSKQKDASKPYAVYCMEMEEAEEGQHNGGTGKSLFAKALSQLRNQVFVSGQRYDVKDSKFMLQEVEKDKTDIIFMDDLNEYVNLHSFMDMVTGDMVVNPKYVSSFTIDFKDSPKIIFTSNHAIRNFDASLRRRTFFCAFSDYYHAENPSTGLPERTPASEFGKQLIYDYDDKEMNHYYNFCFQCLSTWMRYRRKVQPPMKSIERRNLQRIIGDEFIWWADEWFSPDRLDCEVDKHLAFEAYRSTLSQAAQNQIKLTSFMNKVRDFCLYKDWEFTPDRVLATETEKQRKEIRRKVDGKDVYYFYIDSHPNTEESYPDSPPEGQTEDDGRPF